MIIGTSIVVVFATLTIGVFPSFQLGEASLANQGNTNVTLTSIPIADTPFYREHITVTGQNPINAS
jgi:hypothetical protein